ncbi:Inner membrane protein YhjD [Anatilimnocola aggregata]|uniref:Inner membrane protein YhjD n=1 Tax=Anatilimnocola aggregata TaxID=2528021 RepID=A0A517YL93_9BACT|nr:YihY/virulence factor BrkB family protein [Anatilimnocola aggregata]QDU30984.1 Inner membrane protein YhjD [Anatilimnocola aggregata]
MRLLRHIVSVLTEAATEWQKDGGSRMGAALAFYSVLSLAPLLMIALALAGLFFDQALARDHLMTQMGDLVGPEGAQAIKVMLDSGTKSGGRLATILGIATLLFGASGVFGELQAAMDAVWDVKPKRMAWLSMLRARFLSFTMVIGTGFLLLVSLVISTVIASLHKSIEGRLPQLEPIWHSLSTLVTFFIVMLLFALIFKVLPDAKVAWRDVWGGAFLTAALFSVGKLAISLYLGRSGLASGYGAAGSLVVLIVWVYYSSQILFFGAEITHVIARRRNKKIEPTENAVLVAEKD